MLGRIFASALFAGVLAGALVTLAQSARLIPMLLEAERFEMGLAPGDIHQTTVERTASTLMANVVTAVGFALMLVGGFALRGGNMNWRLGIVWGLAGYAAFTVLPGIGLPPLLPGSERPDLFESQDWWLATAGLSIVGMWLIAFSRAHLLKLLGAVVIVIPHVIGAPRPDGEGDDVPVDLAWEFIVGTYAVSALFWIVLGALAGYFFARRSA